MTLRTKARTKARIRAPAGQRGAVDQVDQLKLGPEALLANLASDAALNPNARAAAARTLAEIQGLVGRHQPKPDRTAGVAIETLSREDLQSELSRLRALVLDRLLA